MSGTADNRMLTPIENTMNIEMLFTADRIASLIRLNKSTEIGRKRPTIRKTIITAEPRLIKTGSVNSGICEI